MSEPRTQTDFDRADALLEEILAHRAGAQAAALDAMCAAHPALADTLRRRYQTLATLGLLDAEVDEPAPERLGDFVLLDRIGTGGMGVVYRARQEPLGREVALKLVRPELAYFEKTRARFAREAAAAARLDHPGIVPVYTVGEARGIPFLAMQLIDGGTLAVVLRALWGRDPATLTRDAVQTVLATEARIDTPPAWCEASWPRSAAGLALRLAEALTHAHARGVVHRDVKPGNVMLARDGRVLLLDFGLAVADDAQGLTRTGTVMGSFAYSSPEQVQGQPVDARTDVFSLGTMLHELLALRAAFAGNTASETIERVLRSEPPDLARSGPRVDRGLAAIVRKALEKDAAARYASMAAFAADLRAWLHGGQLSVQPDTPLRRARRFVRQQPLRAGALAAGTVAALASAGWVGFWLANRTPIAVGRAQLQRQAVEREVVTGFIELARERRGPARAAFERALALDAADPEAAAGIAALAPLATEQVRPTIDTASAATLFRFGTMRLFSRRSSDLDAARDAAAYLGLAVERAPVARPIYHFQWLAAAATARDEPAVRRAAAAVVQLWPESPHAQYWLGYAFLEFDPARAAASLRTALAMEAGFVRARADLGVALLQGGDLDGAGNALREVVRVEPGNARAWLDLGIVQERGGDLDAALASLRAATAADENLPGAHYNLARVAALAGDGPAARAGYERTLTLAPDYAEARLNLGLLLGDAGETKAAVEHLEAAAALRPQWPEPQRALGFVHARAGDIPSATRAYLALVQLLPDDVEVHDYLCQLLERDPDPSALQAEQARWKARRDEVRR